VAQSARTFGVGQSVVVLPTSGFGALAAWGSRICN